jgi:hypothetical protein
VVVLLLPLSLAMDNSEFDHGGGGGSGLAAAAAAAVAAVDEDWRRKQPATRASGGIFDTPFLRGLSSIIF